jgi:hypothetical protein
MNTIEDSELVAVVGGDGFWEDLGEFVGGFVGGINFGYPGQAPFQGAVTAGLIAAVVN